MKIRLTCRADNSYETLFLCFNCAVKAVINDNTPIKQEVDVESKYSHVADTCDRCNNELE